jgi:hypothetical protein
MLPRPRAGSGRRSTPGRWPRSRRQLPARREGQLQLLCPTMRVYSALQSTRTSATTPPCLERIRERLVCNATMRGNVDIRGLVTLPPEAKDLRLSQSGSPVNGAETYLFHGIALVVPSNVWLLSGPFMGLPLDVAGSF